MKSYLAVRGLLRALKPIRKAGIKLCNFWPFPVLVELHRGKLYVDLKSAVGRGIFISGRFDDYILEAILQQIGPCGHFWVCPTCSTGRQDACPTEIRFLAQSGTGLRPVQETGENFSHYQVFKSVTCFEIDYVGHTLIFWIAVPMWVIIQYRLHWPHQALSLLWMRM